MPDVGAVRAGTAKRTTSYRPAVQKIFNTRAPTGPSRDRERERDRGIAGGRRGEPKKPSPFGDALKAVRDYWKQGAQQPGLNLGTTPASMVGAFGPSTMSIGAAAVPASRPILNQPVQTNLGAANLATIFNTQPAPSPYEYQPPNPEQAALRSQFYAPDVPLTQLNPETGEEEPMIDPETGEPAVIASPEASPTAVPDTYAGQLKRWRLQMMRMFGATPTLLPDTWMGQNDRLWEQYNAPLPPAEDWWGGGGGGWGDWGGGGGGGYADQQYPWWLPMVNWKIQ